MTGAAIRPMIVIDEALTIPVAAGEERRREDRRQ
jgi:hypothetical protein